MKSGTIQIDQAGRVVLPKAFRDQFNLLPGDKLQVSSDGSAIRLQPVHPNGELVRKGSVLVLTGGFAKPVTTAMVNKLIEGDREVGTRISAGKVRGK